MSQSLHLAIRTLHVLGMALVLGGAVGVWAAARRAVSDLRTLATTYEWLFWAAIGVVVLTGVGNLGALGAPGPSTRWGTTFLLKLPLVIALVVGSAIRTLALVRADPTVPDGALAAWGQRAYGLTTVVLLGLVVVAEVLAHG
jgi:hypothetical protein